MVSAGFLITTMRQPFLGLCLIPDVKCASASALIVPSLLL